MQAISKRSKAKRSANVDARVGNQGRQASVQHGFLARLKDFWLLAVIMVSSVGLGIYETWRSDLPAAPTDFPPQTMLDQRLNLAKTMLELYPERSYGHFLKSYQAGMCWERGYQPEVCRDFAFRDLRDVKAALLDAIERGGNYDQEGLFHFYAFILVQLNEPQEVIDEAVRTWRRHYPYSNKPDPRTMN